MSTDVSTQQSNEERQIVLVTNEVKQTTNEISTQTDSENPILMNQYVFNNICQKVTDTLEKNKIRCNVCLLPFEHTTRDFMMCRQCNKLFHSDCGRNSESKCPACRYRKTSSSYWFTAIQKGQDIHTMIINSVGVGKSLKDIIDYKDMPRNMAPTLEAQYKGITQKISDTFDSIKENPCATKVLQSSMELSNYMMSKCDEIDEAHNNIMKCDDLAMKRLKRLIKKETELDFEIEEAKRQSNVMDGLKNQLQMTLDSLNQHVNVEKKQLADTGNVKDRVKEWDSQLEEMKQQSITGNRRYNELPGRWDGRSDEVNELVD